MTSISKNNSRDEYMEAADAIHNLVVQLVNDDINAGCIASCLTMHATRLSFAACDNPTVIFRNLLNSMLDNIPDEKLNEFAADLDNLITHQTPHLLN